MTFTDTPTKLMQIRYGLHVPGLGHQITTLCYALKYCVDKNMYPILQDDPRNVYGRWADYFEPFWDETQRNEIVKRGYLMEVVSNDLDWKENRSGFFGESWTRLAPEIRDIFLSIFVIKEVVRHEIQSRIAGMELPRAYSSLHVRRGEKNLQFKDYGAMSDGYIVDRVEKELQERGVHDLFVMTDDYSVIRTLRDRTSLNIFTMCRSSYDGNDAEVRTAKGHMLELLTEIVIATQSQCHFQTVNTRVSKMIRLLRSDRNCHHVFDKDYTQYTAL